MANHERYWNKYLRNNISAPRGQPRPRPPPELSTQAIEPGRNGIKDGLTALSWVILGSECLAVTVKLFGYLGIGLVFQG